jgi:hypothetical protein
MANHRENGSTPMELVTLTPKEHREFIPAPPMVGPGAGFTTQFICGVRKRLDAIASTPST